MPNRNPKPPIRFTAHMKPPVTRREPDEQNEPVVMHHLALTFGPILYSDSQRLAHASFYGIVCDVELELPNSYDPALEFRCVIKGPKQGAWEEVDGQMMPRLSVELIIEDFTLTADQLDDIARCAFPKKAPPAAVSILPAQEQLSLDGVDAPVIAVSTRQVNAETGEILDGEQYEEEIA